MRAKKLHDNYSFELKNLKIYYSIDDPMLLILLFVTLICKLHKIKKNIYKIEITIFASIVHIIISHM